MIQPHLAVDLDLAKAKYPLIGLPKIDGVRLMNIIGKATGRSLEAHANLFTTERFSKPIYAGIDGEAAAGDQCSPSLCRDTTSALNTIGGEPDIIWHAFDFLHEDTIELPYEDRLAELHRYAVQAQPAGVVLVPHTSIANAVELKDYYAWCLTQGFEGAIFRDPKGLHKNGRSTATSNGYLRMKPSSDKEALVLRLVEAQKNNNEAKTNALGRTERSTHKENLEGKGMVGMLVCKDLTTGQEIDVGAGKMTHVEREYFWTHQDEIIGQYVKYRSMDSGVKDKPRFARYICIRAKSDMSEEA